MKKITPLISLFFVSCSTTYREKSLTFMGGAFAGGATIGYNSAPQNERKELHGLLWGSISAAVVGAIMFYFYDEGYEIKDKEYKIRDLESKLSDKNNKYNINDGSSSFMESSLPKEYRHLIKPGSWSVYKIDEWKRTSEGELVHQDRLIEIDPPEISIE